MSDESLMLSPAMMRMLMDWRICFTSFDNRTAQALKDRGLVEFGSAFGFSPKWTLTAKGRAVKAELYKNEIAKNPTEGQP